MKKVIRLTELDVERIVKKIIKEESDDFQWVHSNDNENNMSTTMSEMVQEINSLVGKSVEYVSISGKHKFTTKIIGVDYDEDKFIPNKTNQLMTTDRKFDAGVVQDNSQFKIIFDNGTDLSVSWAISSTGKVDGDNNPTFDYYIYYCEFYTDSLSVYSGGLVKGKSFYDRISKSYPKLMIKKFKKYGEL